VVEGISRRALIHLRAYGYPGNIRELQNILRTMVILAHPGQVLDIQHLPQKVIASRSPGTAKRPCTGASPRGGTTIRIAGRSVRALSSSDASDEGNITRAAQVMGLSPSACAKSSSGSK